VRYITLIAIFAVVGVSIFANPLQTGAVIGVALVGLLILRTPRPLITFFLVFLVIQEPLWIVTSRSESVARWVNYADEFLILVLAMGILFLDREVRRALLAHRLWLTIAGCYLGMVLSSLVARSALLPAALDFVLFSKPFLLFTVGLSLWPTDGEIDRTVHPLLLAMGAVAATAVPFLLFPGLQEAYTGHLQAPHERLGLVSVQGIFLGPGALSWFAVATFCLCYAAYLAYERSYYLVYAAVSTVFILLSVRRKSILAVVAVLFVSMLLSTKKGIQLRPFILAGCTLLLAATFLAPYIHGLWFLTVDEYGSLDPYETARSSLYYASLLIARDHFPLGTGFASFGSHASRLFGSQVYWEYGLSYVLGLHSSEPRFLTDTFWPMVLGQGGVISLVSYLSFFALLLWATWRRGRETIVAPSRRFLAHAALFLLVASLFESAASHIYGASMHAALVLVPAGVFWRMVADPHHGPLLRDGSPASLTGM